MAVTRKELKEAIKKWAIMHSYTLKDSNQSEIVFLVEGNRVEKMEEIRKGLEKFGLKAEWKQGISSVGHIRVEGMVTILCKFASRQGRGSAGIENELIIIEAINEACKTGPINIRFIAKDGKKFEALYIKHCKEMGRDVVGRKKADMILEATDGKTYPISIKADSADNVESSDTHGAEKAKKILEKLINEKNPKIELQFFPNKGKNGIYVITPNIVWPATDAEKKETLFGSDILPNGCILHASFGRNPLVYNEQDDFFECQVTHITTNVSESRGKYNVWWILRNDRERNSKKLGYPGLRCLAIFESRISSKCLRVNP